MNETVMERKEKESVDAQWRKYHQRKNGKQNREPTSQQKSYLRFLAKAAGMDLDVSSIRDRTEASALIDELKRKRAGKSDIQGQSDVRDRRIAFGMATKLVYAKWVETHYTPGKSESFWKEVSQLFREYEKHQEAAVSGFADASEL